MTTVYRVLARKYRPATLKDLVGQDILRQTLAQGIENNRLPHAFLLHGIRGVGKTTTARIIARALNCLGADGKGSMTADPCGICSSCTSIGGDRHLDVIEMDAASRTGVDDIREVIESSRYKAVTGRYKVFIIDEVHMLSKSAFNALLKTLEEPPPHVKFIFATTEIRKVPDTILSRCMRFDLKRIEPSLLMSYLESIAIKEGFQVEQEALAALARGADGSMRDGLSLLDQAIALTGSGQSLITSATISDMLGLVDRQRLFILVKHLLEGNTELSLTEIHSLIRDGADAVLILQSLMDLIYWITCLKTAPQLQNDVTWPESDRQKGLELAKALSLPILMRAWQLLLKGYEEVSRSPLPNQALEMVLIRLCYMADLPPLHDLLERLQPGNAPQGTSQSLPSSRPLSSPPAPARDKEQALVATLSPTAPTHSLPNSFEELVKLIEEAREPLLFSHLVHDVHIVSYEPGTLNIRVNDQAPSWFIPRLRLLLQQMTGQEWDIQFSTHQGQDSIAQKKQSQQQQLEKEALSHPVVDALQQAFPGASATVLK